jgi:hypothetical protein
MKYLGILALPLALVVLAFSSLPFQAQSATAPSPSEESAPPGKPLPTDLSGSSYKTRPIPQVEVATPFATNVPESQKTDPLVYLSLDQMSDADRALASSSDPGIREGATLAGIELNVGKWSYQQLVCKALPDHVFLLYRGDNGPGDQSVFSAAIQRGGKGRVRIIPVERRGYSLFSPAAINALTVSAFNRIRADEPDNKSADWLATALCYAALAGARPALSPHRKAAASATDSLVFPPTLEIGSLGDSTVRFIDLALDKQPTEWALTFNPKGELLKVDHFATPDFAATPIPAK